MNKVKILIFSIFVFSLFTVSESAFSQMSCRALYGPTTKMSLREVKADQLAQMIAIDADTQALVANPLIAQYIYINFFADDMTPNERKAALSDLAKSNAGNTDIFDLINNKLVTKLNDPEVQARVKEAFGSDDRALRPGATRSRFAKVIGNIKQAKGLLTTFARLKKLTTEGLSQDTMERGLFDFYGATQLGLRESQLRAWNAIPGGFAAIRPDQIENMTPDVWADIARMASETEMPIHGYSTVSGDVLRAYMPTLSAFMGKTAEEYQAYQTHEQLAKANGEEPDQYCTNVWCKEENRHEIAVQTMGEQVDGIHKTDPKTYDAGSAGEFTSAEGAIKHVVGRNSSEWNANSVYFLMRAHSKDAANGWVDNVRQDETKHIAIFSAAFRYIYGSQPNLRTKGMWEKIMALKKQAATKYSDANVLNNETLTLLEMAVTHYFVEMRVRDYLKTVPLKTMQKFFDSPATALTSAPSDPVSPEKQKVIDEMAAREKESRAKLERWKPKERERYLALKKVEQDQGPLIENFITHLFNNFSGAEVYGSDQSKAVVRQIGQIQTGLDTETNSLIQLSLTETLRDYQIVNNSFVRSRPDLVVKLKSAAEGFVVEKLKGSPAKVLGIKKLTNQHMMVRVEKPKDFNVEAGSAAALGIYTKTGLQTRVLSVSNSPMQSYLEFAVGISNSDFKKNFAQLKEGNFVYLELLKNQMPFKPDVPAVMIAGGIGITPFRSMLQYADETGFKAPMWLFYGNRSEIPFENEINGYAKASENFNVIHTLSKPPPNWQGRQGRIDEKFLNEVVPTLPKEANYYIVGAPDMITGTKANLIRLGIPSKQIFTEVFFRSTDSHQVSGSTTTAAADTKEKKDDDTICFCHSVTRGQIESVISAGAHTLSAIQTQTNAATGCGGCKCSVETMLKCAK